MQENFNMEELMDLLFTRQFRKLKDILTEMNEVDIAAFIDELDSEKAVVVFRILPKELAADVFACLSVEKQQHIITSITDREVATIIEDLFVDDAVDMLEELLDRAWNLPLSGGRCVVDAEKVHELVDDIRLDVPAGKGTPKEFYILKPVSNPASTIFVPTGSPALVEKMARLPNREELDQLILSVKDHPLPWIEDARPAWPAFKPL